MKFLIVVSVIAVLAVSLSNGAPQNVVSDGQSVADPVADPPTEAPVAEPPTEAPVAEPPTEAPVPEPPTTADTSSDTTQTEGDSDSWIDQKVQQINGLIKGQGEVAKDTAGLMGTGIQKGTKLATATADLTTKIAQKVVDGSLQIGSMSMGAGSELAKKGMDIMSKWGNLLPGYLGKGVQSIAALGTKGVDKMQDLGNQVLGSVGNAMNTGLQNVNGLVHKGSDLTTSTVQTGTDKVQSIIDRGVNGLTNTIKTITG